MLRSVYVINENGVVDDSEKLGNQLPSYYLNRTNHTGTQSADTVVDGTTNKVYTATEKTKLAGIAINANNYTHPANHPASIITQDSSNRFVSDAEKSTWNAKQNALGFTPENIATKSPLLYVCRMIPDGRVFPNVMDSP